MDSFDETNQYMIAPDLVAFGDLTASANVAGEVLQNNTSSSATAMVDPIIVVADQLIPGGGGASYRDHFEIEFSNGSWALGPVPTRETTWGKIKQLYAN